MRRVSLLCLAVAVVALLGVAPTPVAAQELTVDNVDVPNSVTADESFDIAVDVTTEGIDQDGVDVTLALPEQLTCSPSGSQTIAGDGTETAIFACDPAAPGDYNGEIDVTVSGTTTDGNSISDSATTGLVVNSPASLSMTTGIDADRIDEGESTALTVSVSNAGDVSTSYELSVSPASGLSASLDSGPESGSIDGGDTAFVSYTLTGGSDGEHDVAVALTGGNGQDITRAKTVSVLDGGGGGGGGATSSTDATGAEIIENLGAIEALDPPTDVEPVRAERATITVDEGAGQATVTFTEASATASITFEGDVEGDVTVAEYDAEPESTGPSPGRSLSVTQIDVPEPDRAATIRTRVPTERLEDIDADAADLRVNRFDEDADEWQPLDTELVGTTDEHVVVEAETPGFSFFSVSAVGQPEAAIDAPSETTVGEEITLDGSDSSDEYGEIVAYEWTVGGETLTGETVATTPDAAGEVTVELTVENGAGETDRETATISVVESDAGTDATGTDPEPGTETPPEGLPGFGAALALVALLVAALLARRRV